MTPEQRVEQLANDFDSTFYFQEKKGNTIFRRSIIRHINEAVAAEREACAKLADFWASDEGLSPCHGQGNRFGQKVAGSGIASSIRARGNSS